MSNKIAPPEEVLEALSASLRGGNGDERPGDRFKAAELLGKHYGLFQDRAEEPAIAPETARALEQLVKLAVKARDKG